ncbi:uncharacterized protein LOC124927349 [Impatiens glandulifera]|uniref:uncharacterized protein LOC124927349 n=1 Tax=Impatiens glandulifera TaxID=253017 RepID=UPI001FB09C52|nr:uncharacterized protein LOC124927349 [Impatiens glandulifera]
MEIMATNQKTFLTLLLLSIIISVSSQIDPPLPIHELLPKYGLPTGLFPDSVKSYTLSEDDRITIELGSPCTVEFEYTIWYDSRITGKLGYGSITGLKGIQLQRLYVWFDVSDIRIDSPPTDDIYFHIMMFDNSLNVDQFKAVRSCSKNAWNRLSSKQGRFQEEAFDTDDSKALVTDE